MSGLKDFKDSFNEKTVERTLKTILSMISSFLNAKRIDEYEKLAVASLDEYFQKNEGNYFFISPVVCNGSLNLILGILKDNPDGSISFVKQIPVKFNDMEIKSIPVKKMMKSIFSSEINIFKYFKEIKKKES